MFIEGSAIMRKILKKLGDAELEMMCAVWELDRPFQRSELNPRLNKNWAGYDCFDHSFPSMRQTVSGSRKKGTQQHLYSFNIPAGVPAVFQP